jgi:hypothetical protein
VSYSYDCRNAASRTKEHAEREEGWLANDRRELKSQVKRLQKQLSDVWTANGETLRLARSLLDNKAFTKAEGGEKATELVKGLVTAIETAESRSSDFYKLIQVVGKTTEGM